MKRLLFILLLAGCRYEPQTEIRINAPATASIHIRINCPESFSSSVIPPNVEPYAIKPYQEIP